MTEAANRNGASDAYYSHDRYEVARLIPTAARQILDVGCASGRLGQLVKALRPDAEVRGIEPVAEAAARARELLDAVRVGHAEDDLPVDWPAPDCLVLADVLEHLADPWATLAHLRRQAAPGAALVVSVPNVAHWSLRMEVARGRWRYRDEGLLDRTHLRFFDPNSAVRLIEGAGYRIERRQRVISQIPPWRITGLDHNRFRAVVDEGPPGHPLGRTQRWLMDLLTFQFLMVAR